MQQPLRFDLSIRRRAFLSIVLSVIVGGHVFCLLFTAERWPFSRYPMYSKPSNPSQTEQYVLVGVEPGDPPREIELYLNWDYLRPLYRGSLHYSFKRLARQPERGLLQAAAADCLRRYEQRRQQGLHAGPALAATRVYRYTWRYADVDPIQRRPTDRLFLAEARLPNSLRSQ